MLGKKKNKRDKNLPVFVEDTSNSKGEKVLEAVAEEEFFVQSEVEHELEAVAEENIIAEVEAEPQIDFLDSEVDDASKALTDEQKAAEAEKIAEAARKIAQAAQKISVQQEEVQKEQDAPQVPIADVGVQEKSAEQNAKNEKLDSDESGETDAQGNASSVDGDKGSETIAQKSSDADELKAIILEAEVDAGDVNEEDEKESKVVVAGLMQQVTKKQEAEPSLASADVTSAENLDDEEMPKPLKLAKLPLFIDYCLEQNLKFKTYLKVAKVLITALDIYKDSPENKEIILVCIKKLIPAFAEVQA